jgi:hypothetical protein
MKHAFRIRVIEISNCHRIRIKGRQYWLNSRKLTPVLLLFYRNDDRQDVFEVRPDKCPPSMSCSPYRRVRHVIEPECQS